MYKQVEKPKKNKCQSIANTISQKRNGGESTFQFVSNRPEVRAQKKLQEILNNSLQAKRAIQLQSMVDNHSGQQKQPTQKKENSTGLPDNLKSGVENLSGYSLDDVKVHYNSDKTAPLQAHAYVQGTDIHLAPRQEKHLPHEAWHVVQQKQGRVKPTTQLKKVNINKDASLEREADIMGAKSFLPGNEKDSPLQHIKTESKITQRKKGEPNQAQKELSNLANEIQENKNDIEGVSPAMIDHAISALHEAASSDDKAAATKVFDKLKAVGKGQIENVPEAINPEPVQKMSKAKKGAWIGIVIGTIIPVVGNIIGGLIGHAKGKQADLNELMVAYPALTLGDLNIMTQAGAGTYRIRNQLDTINGNNIAQLIQLYNRGASPSNISRLLGFENNGVTLHNLLGLEANNDARRIVTLYQDGINSTIMYDLLRVQSNGQTIHNYYTNVVPGCTVATLQFGSQSGGNFGSIYFNFGRIRLIHPNQPVVEHHAPGFLGRATFNVNDLNTINNYWNNNVRTGTNTPQQMYNMAIALGSYQVAAAGVGGMLVEFYIGSYHPSRGTPVAFPVITQNELNVIANVANLNSNAVLRAWMNAIPNLNAIPMN